MLTRLSTQRRQTREMSVQHARPPQPRPPTQDARTRLGSSSRGFGNSVACCDANVSMRQMRFCSGARSPLDPEFPRSLDSDHTPRPGALAAIHGTSVPLQRESTDSECEVPSAQIRSSASKVSGGVLCACLVV